MKNVKRRDFLKTAAAVTAAGSLGSTDAFAAGAPTIVVVEGKDIPKMMAAGMKELGGWEAFVKKGGKVTIKVNGQVVNEANDCEVTPGKICLTAEGDEIHFRNLKLR